jgi:predicted ATPase/DNA-binding winged helix-turn-helix (wHTH) protein
MAETGHAPSIYEEAGCEVDLGRRELRTNGVANPIGGRAFEIIEALVRSAGQLVTKEELMDRVWPGAVVGDNTLQVHISALRKALGAQRGMLRTESGRGYRLVGTWTPRLTDAVNLPAPVALERLAAQPPTQPPMQPPTGNLPPAMGGLYGRAESLERLRDLLSAYRVVTLTGPGGIGKTALGLEVAGEVAAGFDDGAWLVELASLADPALVPSSVAAALGLRFSGEAISVEAVARGIGGKNLLLLLDNCEHVVDAAAELSEAIVRLCPHTTLLATSREVLSIDGEHVYRVPPLDVPDPGENAPDHLLGHSAVELFLARMRALDLALPSDRETLALAAAICRHLDGIPLAIEFAAARAATLGLAQVAAGLEDRFGLLTSGRRTALPRHRTLRAVLDWSYDLLPEGERLTLRCLSIFSAGFGLEAAVAVIGDLPASRVVDAVTNLVAKSLVMAETGGLRARYRLLETTRVYAREKLVQAGEFDATAHRHAEYYRDLFERAEAASEKRPAAEWLAEYGREIDNLRAALDWAFSPGGETAIGVALTVASGLLWTRLSLVDECRRLAERALSALASGSDLAARHQIQLLALLGWSLQQTSGATSETRAAFSKILELSERMHDIKFKSLAMWGLWIYHFNNGEFANALDLAQKSIAEEGVDIIHSLAGERIIGLSLHYLGEQSSSRRQIESVLRRPVDPLHQPQDLSFAIDHRVTLRAFLARILWLQGFPDQAMRTAKENVEEALALNHALSLANALVQAACPVAFFTGDLVAAEHFVRMLLDHSTKHALGPWQAWGHCFEAMLLIKRGDTVTGLQGLSTAVRGLRDIGYAVYYVAFTGELAEALGRAGQAADGLATIDEALARSEHSEERWCIAELLRIKGELIVLQGASGATRAAEEHFRRSLNWSRQQEVLSWELRTTTSLARLLRDQCRMEEARTLLGSVYNRFSEGFATADLRTAKQLLDQLA